MFKISKTIQILALWVVIALLFITAYVVFFSFFDKKNESVSSLLNTIEQSVHSDQQSRDLNNFFESIVEESAEIETFFLHEEDQVIEFLEEVESLSGVTGASVEVKSIRDVKDADDLVTHFDFNVITRGSFRSVYHFFILLQNMPYKIDMEQVKLEFVGRDEDGVDMWSGIFNFTVVHSND